jgi:hypothetical protein
LYRKWQGAIHIGVVDDLHGVMCAAQAAKQRAVQFNALGPIPQAADSIKG